MSQNIKLWHALYEAPGIGEGTIMKLMRAFPNPNDALHASGEQLSTATLSSQAKNAFLKARPSVRDADTAWEELTDQNISVVSILDDVYPKLLKEIPDPPPLLYYRGSIDILNAHSALAIVGTRKPTDYGRHVTKKLAEELSRAGLIIVSGLALGLDAEAHRGALESKGLTVAVLGNGLAEKCIAPRNNLALSKSIAERGGCVLSEFPPRIQASTGTFPMRNRIVAGLTLGTIVVEAAERSGTLITARLALEYNRDVFAVPGSILSPLSQGANKLLKKGAHAVTATEDILEILQLSPAKNNQETPLPDDLAPEEKTILNLLSAMPHTSQEIAQKTSMNPTEINTYLTMLELNGFIRDIGNGKFIKNF